MLGAAVTVASALALVAGSFWLVAVLPLVAFAGFAVWYAVASVRRPPGGTAGGGGRE